MTDTTIDAITLKAMNIARTINALLARCQACGGKDAEIFSTYGEFCCECWQIRTHPDI